jgi:hypothetical protein
MGLSGNMKVRIKILSQDERGWQTRRQFMDISIALKPTLDKGSGSNFLGTNLD